MKEKYFFLISKSQLIFIPIHSYSYKAFKKPDQNTNDRMI